MHKMHVVRDKRGVLSDEFFTINLIFSNFVFVGNRKETLFFEKK
jgi:hypothetical protein